jgi:hypothetical protein
MGTYNPIASIRLSRPTRPIAPVRVDLEVLAEADERVPHEGHAAAL